MNTLIPKKKERKENRMGVSGLIGKETIGGKIIRVIIENAGKIADWAVKKIKGFFADSTEEVADEVAKEQYDEDNFEQMKRIDSDLNRYKERLIKEFGGVSKAISEMFSKLFDLVKENIQDGDNSLLGDVGMDWLESRVKVAKQNIELYFNNVTSSISRDNDKLVKILKGEDARVRKNKTKEFICDETQKIFDKLENYVIEQWNQINGEIQKKVKEVSKRVEGDLAQVQGDLQGILDSKDEADKERKYLEMQCRISELEHLSNELNTLWQRLK